VLLPFLASVLIAPHHGDGLRPRSPAEVGMSPERLEIVDRVVQRGISAGGFPGAAVIIGRHGSIVYERAFGSLSWPITSRAVSTDETIYDLASLTKVVGTTTAAMVLYDEGRLDLDAPVSRYIPEFSGGMKDLVTVRHLLTHQSGLPPGRDVWRRHVTPAAARQLVLSTKLGYRPGTVTVYSDLGADILGWVVESAAGATLDRVLHDRVFAPLGMHDTGFKPADSLRYRIAPTEIAPPRGYPLRGEVHDENAYALGGIVGHAGLFSTAADLAVFAQMMLNNGTYNGTRVVADSTVRLFTARATRTRTLGWEIGDGQHGAGDYFGEHAYGHTGFTGTSLWIDPERDMFVVLLTNRVHAAKVRRPSLVIADVRQDVADAAALAVLDEPFAVAMLPESFRADRGENWNRPFRGTRVRRTTTGMSAAAKAAVATPAKRPPASKAAAKPAAANRRTTGH
jgi:CubicO group peptidase (beta-lactamase class C family)